MPPISTIRAKKFTVTISPEYRDGRLLLLTVEEAKLVAASIIEADLILGHDHPLMKWATEVYFA